MKKVNVYQYVDEAIASLDNGGRFYNILTKANDGVISQAELGKVGGVFNDIQKMILFFELATSELAESNKMVLLSKMEDKLKKGYHKFTPQKMIPSEAIGKGVLSSSAILTGIPEMITSKTDFNGFIMVPVMTGKTTTFIMVPLIDAYDIYELKDDLHSETFIIAHAKSKEKLPNKKIKVAGVFKELKAGMEENSNAKMFLEMVYYSDLP
ncbi:hypothetical protein [Flavivirga algicola]|uniref:Uncharacterized protein n=1 Tax=Flavivirga algicola TaxID=2729136 RepID=A0ABX1RXB4_9FLAO|nr:hypothetical protein [Flavivirga algicola]NMH87418.1 hypothetical protein [Flavivirga algicola]